MRGRVLRAMKQRMFVMSRELSAQDDTVEKFEVIGSIGNVSRAIPCCLPFSLLTQYRLILSPLVMSFHAHVWTTESDVPTANTS